MIETKFVTGGVLIVSLNRPEKLNAINDELLKILSDKLEEADKDKEVRVVIIFGNENCFAAGADIGELLKKDLIGTINDSRPKNWEKIAGFKKPLIASVNGYAYGAGCELALHADMIIAGHNAQFALPEVKLGIMPGAGGTQRILRSVGKSLAMQMCLTGDPIDANTAKEHGLVSELTVPEATLSRSLKIALKIAKMSPLALRQIKKSILNGLNTSLSDGLEYERQAFITLSDSEDKKEGISAFLEKRSPIFKGR